MAPEVMCRQNHTTSVDFFAVGVMAYECMFGRVSTSSLVLILSDILAYSRYPNIPHRLTITNLTLATLYWQEQERDP